jgi:hypothetical protein
MKYLECPNGPCFDPNDPSLIFLIVFAIVTLLIPLGWMVVEWRNWKAHKFAWNSQSCALFISLTFLMLAQVCVVGQSVSWGYCLYPYIYLLPAPIGSNCTATLFYRLGDILYGIGPPIFILVYVNRFEPVYTAFRKNRILIFHRFLHGIVSITSLLMLCASLSSAFRRWDVDVNPTEPENTISEFENQTYAFYGIIITLVNMGTTTMGAIFVYRKMRSIKLEINPSNELVQDFRSLVLTFASFLFNFIAIIFFSLSSIGDILPNFMALPLPMRSQIQSWLIQMYFSFMMVGMIMFGKSIKKKRTEPIRIPVETSCGASRLLSTSAHLDPRSSSIQQSHISLGVDVGKGVTLAADKIYKNADHSEIVRVMLVKPGISTADTKD